jgi:hypothetical protein
LYSLIEQHKNPRETYAEFLLQNGEVSAQELAKEMEKKFLDWVSYTRSIYDTVFELDGFMILRRR